MTKPKTPEPVDPKLAFLEVFKRTGGIAGMTTWAKTHRTLFYSLFGKLISQPLVQTNINNTIKVDEVQARAALAHAFHRIIDSRELDKGAVYVDGERVYEDGQAPVTIEHAPRPDLAQPPSPAPSPADIDPAQPSAAPQPDNVVNIDRKPFHPAARPPQAAPRELTSTELFYEYRGRDPWSPP
ncbi:hypothetical protein [Bradyrhizobium lablabi]|uniref:hypothetical protein n=1 Tax=Bradyrhizobium lablabi TaxID=722472 RepID=UPI00090BD125|nr:hypothetical protein [Bradyrhizobium lablabi]SHK94244.1 hypothetical protein SAMN05444321_1224 [Bradyrhizobium lablabi]